NVTLGKSVYIGAYCVIGGPPEHKEFWDKPYKGVIIGDNVRISNHVTIDSGTVRDTVVSDGCILLRGSHVGHDAYLGKNVILSCSALIGGHAEIGDNCNIGLNASVHQKVVVPEGCMIGMNSCITKKTDLKP